VYKNHISNWAASKVALNEWHEESLRKEHTQKMELALKNQVLFNEREERICNLRAEELQLKIDILKLKKKRLEFEIRKAFELS
jgi:hypothetical protein